MNAEDAMPGRTNLAWQTSSYSTGSGGECVEVALTADSVYVRDSKWVAQGGAALKISSAAWSVLLETM